MKLQEIKTSATEERQRMEIYMTAFRQVAQELYQWALCESLQLLEKSQRLQEQIADLFSRSPAGFREKIKKLQETQGAVEEWMIEEDYFTLAEELVFWKVKPLLIQAGPIQRLLSDNTEALRWVFTEADLENIPLKRDKEAELKLGLLTEADESPRVDPISLSKSSKEALLKVVAELSKTEQDSLMRALFSSSESHEKPSSLRSPRDVDIRGRREAVREMLESGNRPSDEEIAKKLDWLEIEVPQSWERLGISMWLDALKDDRTRNRAHTLISKDVKIVTKRISSAAP